MIDQKLVRLEDVFIETIARCQPEHRHCVLLQLGPRVGTSKRAYTRIIKDNLLRLSLASFSKSPIKLQDVGDILADFVSSAVATDNNILHSHPNPSDTRSLAGRVP